MTRFILTLGQAVKLVFKAAEESVGGEIFIVKIPSVKVGDIAKVMLEKVPESIRPGEYIIGIRPGEKVHEVLVSEEEAFRTIDLGEFYCILPAVRIKAINEKYKQGSICPIKEYTSGTANRYSNKDLSDLLEEEGWIPSIHKFTMDRPPEKAFEERHKTKNRLSMEIASR